MLQHIIQSHVDCNVPQTCLLCRQTEEDPARVQWCPSGGPAPVFQMTSWLQTLEPQACSHLVLWFWISLGWGWWWSVWSMKGLCTVPVICWRSLWRWGPACQHRISDRLVWHRLGLVLSSSSASGRPGTPRLCWSVLHVWGRGGLLEVLMVVWRGVQSKSAIELDFPQCWGMVSCIWLSLSDLSTLLLSHWKIIGSLAFQNNSSLLLWSPFQCVFGLFIQDFIPFSVSIFFGLTEMYEFCSEPRFVIVVG